MLQDLCICTLVPSVETRTRWVFLQHRSEETKTTNTGHLAHRSLVNSQLCSFHSRTEPPRPEPAWPLDGPVVLLFPRPGGVVIPLEELAGSPLPVTVVVPDGTWTQTRKIVRCVSPLPELATVALPDEAFPRLSLREETFDGGFSTIDAVAWLLAALEGSELADPLVAIHRRMVERTLASRGTPLPDGPRMVGGRLVEAPVDS